LESEPQELLTLVPEPTAAVNLAFNVVALLGAAFLLRGRCLRGTGKLP
jgi:hypothetical protein